MDDTLPTWPPAALAGWIALQEGQTPERANASFRQVAARLDELAAQHASQICGRPAPVDPPGQGCYRRRLWLCAEYHWRRLAAAGPLPFARLLARLEAGDLGHGAGRSNVLFEVTLAQALELGEAHAAGMFEKEYSPIVRAVAQRTGGPRAREAVDNFAAELVLPRGDRPPRIAGYQGRTSLASWLKAVVVNYWLSLCRKRAPASMASPPETPVAGDAALQIDRGPCQQLLEPLFAQAMAGLQTEDRLLLKMLLLDGAPQNELARSLGVNSGTLTRRRQRAAAQVLNRLRESLEQSGERRRAEECLQLVLSGDDENLKQRLAEVLARGIAM